MCIRDRNGVMSECSSAPLCEATGGSKCYYISLLPISKNAGAGTYENPWKSLSKINSSNLSPGDFVYIRSGHFNGADARLNISSVNGSSSKPITIRSYPGEKVSLRGGNVDNIVSINNSSYINIKDIEFNGSNSKSFFIQNSSNINICLLYTSPSPRDATLSRMPSSA